MELISKEDAVALIKAEMDKIRTHSLVDGTPVYEDGYGLDEDGEVVYLCDIYECEDCPRFGDDCDGK